MKYIGKIILYIVIFLSVSIFFCEYLIFEIAISKCSWPKAKTEGRDALHILFLADPHLLGPFRGHWLDKLRREWQIKRCFQAAYKKLNPDYVVILGDLFDEGELVQQDEWDEYLRRFYDEIFYMADRSKLKVIVGNHDVGFHDTIYHDTSMWKRFQHQFDLSSSVQHFQLKSTTFVSINSMALKDYCDFCSEASQKIIDMKSKLSLALREQKQCNCTMRGDRVDCKFSPSSPVILQHFPLYRTDETQCMKFDDGPTKKEATKRNRESWDVLSEDSTKFLLHNLQPCILISGHTHHGCFVENRGVYELTVPSMSWRNINNPSIVMGTFENGSVSLQKCRLPKETTVIAVYIVVIFVVMLYVIRIRTKSVLRGRIFKVQ